MNRKKIEWDRLADLHYAYQHGQAAVKGNFTKIEAEFIVIFGCDVEARAEFNRGVTDECSRMNQTVNNGGFLMGEK